ncbi:MAG: PQQ-dependent sugar dehydrogenase [Phycisphaeraceae bacterium]|nr:PQQ-dependent sugar dehydrogenase [Phycisphaeraceae bacterium]MCW5763120.1 PQQ-dependent sugar dehydrogenase [Phycisphaeraceae bacterium]
MRRVWIGVLGAAIGCSVAAGQGYVVEQIAGGLNHPLDLAQAPGDATGLYIAEQRFGMGTTGEPYARILRLDASSGVLTTFLTVDVSLVGDAGLHGLAFHPDYATNGRVYVTVMEDPPSGNRLLNRLYEYTIKADEEPTRRLVLSYPQNANSAIHGIGWIGFRPYAPLAERSWLYVFVGDGGPQASSGSYVNRAQQLDLVYGKVLRIDVDGEDLYPDDPDRNFGVPMGNPFHDGDPGSLPEVLCSGLRSPWRGGFDALTGDLLIGDVGFFSREEINIVRPDRLGEDFGWPSREGTIEMPVPGVGGPRGDSVDPIHEWAHSTGNVSITGGLVYRGPIGSLRGRVFFGDYVSGRVWSGVFDRQTDPADFNGQNIVGLVEHSVAWNAGLPAGQVIARVVSFATDLYGNLYVLNYGSGNLVNPTYGTGAVFRLRVLCQADFNGDGLVDFFDVQAFLGAFATDAPEADLNGDRAFDFFDVQMYLGLFSAGCG